MSHNYYEVIDPDDQAGTANYPFVVQVWTPQGRTGYAASKVEVKDHHVEVYGVDGDLVGMFSAAFPFIAHARKHTELVTESEAFERSLEAAQAQQMQEKRAKAILNPDADKGYM